MLPIIELLSAAIIMIVPTLRLFTRLKLMAHGSASVSLAFGEFVVNIPSDRFLSFAFDRAAWWAEGPITILNTPAKFVEPLVSLIVAREGHWWPRSLQSYAWHVFIYPIYALPAWIYIGFAIDAAIGHRRVHRWNVILSVLLALTCALLFCAFRFGVPAAKRAGQESVNWFIDYGFAIWAVLFSIPVLAWMRQKKRRTLVRNEPLPS
jgi:hypothetical protein